MKNPISTCKLWCRSEESLIEFDIEIGTPIQTDDPGFGRWSCEWSVGELWEAGVEEYTSMTSFHALAGAMRSACSILIMREDAIGDMFYTDAEQTDRIEDLEVFLMTKRYNKKQTEQVAASDA